MPFNRSTYIPGESEPSVYLKCGNIRVAFLLLCMIFWLFSLVILCHIAAYSGHPKLASYAQTVNNFFSENTKGIMAGPIIFLATFLYFYWSRKRLSWFNGVMIDDQAIDVLHYQFKRTIINVPWIYLQTATRTYILYPVTSQDGRKLPNANIMAKEMAANEIQVALLQEKLLHSAATEKIFWFFTSDVIISFLIAIAVPFVGYLTNL